MVTAQTGSKNAGSSTCNGSVFGQNLLQENVNCPWPVLQNINIHGLLHRHHHHYTSLTPAGRGVQ